MNKKTFQVNLAGCGFKARVGIEAFKRIFGIMYIFM